MTKTILLATAAVLATVSVANACSTNIRKTDYFALKTGMTIDQANAIVGCEGQEQMRVGARDYEMVSYVWEGPQRFRGGMLLAVFMKGRLSSKVNMNLE